MIGRKDKHRRNLLLLLLLVRWTCSGSWQTGRPVLPSTRPPSLRASNHLLQLLRRQQQTVVTLQQQQQQQ